MRHQRLISATTMVGLALTATACGGSSEADSDAATDDGANKVQVMLFSSIAYTLPFNVADQKGFFEEVGIDASVVEQPTGLQGTQGLEATNSDATLMSVITVSQGKQAGADMKIFCGGYQYIQGSFMAPLDTDLPSVADGATWEEVVRSLEGKKVGSETPIGSGVQLMLEAAISEGGAENVTFVNVGTNAQAVTAALSQGSVDVVVAQPPLKQFLEKSGTAKELLKSKEGPSLYQNDYNVAWAATDEWLTENGESADLFCEAVTEAVDYINDPANSEEMAQMLADTTKMDPEIAAMVVDSGYFAEYDTHLPIDDVEAAINNYTDLGILKPEPAVTVADLVDDHSPTD